MMLTAMPRPPKETVQKRRAVCLVIAHLFASLETIQCTGRFERINFPSLSWITKAMISSS